MSAPDWCPFCDLLIALHLPRMQHPELVPFSNDIGISDTISQFPLKLSQPKHSMYLHRVLVVTFVAFLACVAIVSASTAATLDFDTNVENWDDVGSKRLLRTDDGATEDRVFGFSGLVENVKLSYNLRTRLKAGDAADIVGKSLMGETSVKRVLSDPNFNRLVKYVQKYNKKYPEQKVRTVDVLSKMYGEAAVAKMLVNLKGTNEWATSLLGNQVAGWIEHNTPVGVLKIFGSVDATKSPLVTENLKAWDNYMVVLATRDPKKVISRFTAFRRAYEDEGLARLIDASKIDLKAAPLAFDFKKSLFRRWVGREVTMNNINSKIFKSETDNSKIYKNGLIDNVAERIKSDYAVYLRTGQIY